MILAVLTILIQVVALSLMAAMSWREKDRSEAPLYRFGEVVGGHTEWRPYPGLRYKHPRFIGYVREHYLSERPKELESSKGFRSRDAKALYELQVGAAPIERYMGEDFWDGWREAAQAESLPPTGDVGEEEGQ